MTRNWYKKKRVNFANYVKLNTLHADLVPSMQRVSMMCMIYHSYSTLLQNYFIWQIGCIMSHDQWWCMAVWCNWHWWVVRRKLRQYIHYKKGKLCVKVRQVDGSKRLHNLWLVWYCARFGANHFSLTCEPLQGSKISSNTKNNIVLNTAKGNAVLDCQIKNGDGWVTRV